MNLSDLPVAIIGAGPVGLAAAAHLNEYGQDFVVLEAGERVGASVRQWGHVRMFSAWENNIDRASAKLLEGSGWSAPELSHIPSGDELLTHYLEPIASCPPIKDRIKLGSRVLSVTKLHVDRASSRNRDHLPFELVIEASGGETRTTCARAVIDASGVLDTPRPIGANGLPIPGETECKELITYGIPRPSELTCIGERVLVLGSGHSAMQSVVALTSSSDRMRRQVDWALRKEKKCGFLCAAGSDRFPARLALQSKAQSKIATGQVRVRFGAVFTKTARTPAGITLTSIEGGREAFDHVVVATGYRPDFAMVRELQSELDSVYECPAKLGPILDAAKGCCGAVLPHGEAELRHPEAGFYVVGMRSFGRASSFLMQAGYEQVRTIAAKLAGDLEAMIPRPAGNFCEMALEDFIKQHPYYLGESFG